VLGDFRFTRTVSLCAALVAFGVGMFSGANGSEADAVDGDLPAAFQVASLPPVFPQAEIRLLAPGPVTAAPAITASLPSPATLEPFEQSTEPFGVATSTLTSGGLVQKWRSVDNGVKVEQRLLEMCRRNAENCVPAARRFLAVVELGAKAQGRARIGLINRAINLAIRPASDREQYGLEDLWATPLMTFASGAGDCEDYAIAKYVALREAGIAESDLRLVVVRNTAAREFHAVAAVRDGGRWLILDNRTLAIRDAVDIAEYNPLFVIGDAGVQRLEQTASNPRRIQTDAKVAGTRPVRLADEPHASRGPGQMLAL
jgi:predicted transglutaminase-like cysteine proteinase